MYEQKEVEMSFTRQHRIAIVVAVIMVVLLYYVNVVRDGTAW